MNKRIIQKIYAAFKYRDIPSILELQSENADWSVAASTEKIPWANPGRGHKGVANFLKTIRDCLVHEVFVVQEYIESPNKVVAIGYQAGYIKPTGDHYEYDFVHVWELEEGKVTKFRVYFDTAYVAGALAGEPKTAV
jgi:ketosteroid isomerase-like protein